MKFKLKALAVSLALVVSLPASAAVSNTMSSQGSELVVTLWNSVTQKSASFDLGVTKSAFNASTNQTFSLNTGEKAAAWASFFETGNVSDVKYGVFAGNSRGGDGEQSFMTTGAATWTDIMNGDVISVNSKIDDYLLDLNNNATFNSAANGGAYISDTSANAYAGNAYDVNGAIVGLGYDMLGSVTSNMVVWNVNNAAEGGVGYITANAAKIVNSGFDAYFSLNSATGDLTYTATAVAAVPEADTSAMMLAGLGLMGFIARRRKSV